LQQVFFGFITFIMLVSNRKIASFPLGKQQVNSLSKQALCAPLLGLVKTPGTETEAMASAIGSPEVSQKRRPWGFWLQTGMRAVEAVLSQG
jgi:hypothetical protein